MAPPKGFPKPPGSGRKKGQVNKYTQAFKVSLLEAINRFGEPDGLNGTDALLAWGRQNPSQFYQIAARLIPHEVVGPEGGPLQVKTIQHIHEKGE